MLKKPAYKNQFWWNNYSRHQTLILTLSFCLCFPHQVKEEMLLEALTTRKTVTVGERLIVPYKLAEVTFCIPHSIYIQQLVNM